MYHARQDPHTSYLNVRGCMHSICFRPGAHTVLALCLSVHFWDTERCQTRCIPLFMPFLCSHIRTYVQTQMSVTQVCRLGLFPMSEFSTDLICKYVVPQGKLQMVELFQLEVLKHLWANRHAVINTYVFVTTSKSDEVRSGWLKTNCAQQEFYTQLLLNMLP